MPKSRLDHFIGYTVQEVEVHELTLDDGWKIIFNNRKKLDTGLAGQRLTAVEETPDGNVRLLFNEGEAGGTKGKIELFRADTGETIDPYEEVDPNEGLPPDPSSERISPGPTDEQVKEELSAVQGEEAGEAE
jgi:hypothetical protein